MAGISQLDVAAVLFNGQSDIVVFDEVEDYDTATLTNVTASGSSLGQIVEDSTSWDGEEPSLSEIKDEQGDVITVTPESGTLAFSCDIASTSANVIEIFLKGKKVTTPGSSTTLGAVSDVMKFGTELPVITRPIAIINDLANRVLFFPKAKIVGNLALDSKLWRVHISVTAEFIDTTTLGTGMIMKAKPVYETDAPGD